MVSKLTFDMQWDRSTIFERWSMPVKDFFGDFLAEGDYVNNRNNAHGLSGGIAYKFISKNYDLDFGLSYGNLISFKTL